MTVTEQVRDEAGVQALADAARALKAHDADASQRQAHRSEPALQGGRAVKGGAEHPIGSPAECGMERYTLLSA